MPSEQPMIVETMHQPMRMTHVQFQDSVTLQAHQQSKINIFGCPAYLLKKELQDHKKIRKWSDRTRLGINLGYFDSQLTITGLVSPQYHFQYDDLFETTMRTQARSIPTSPWQFKAGFTSDKPDIDEDDGPIEELWDKQSFEEYYSSQESEETSTPSDLENEENDEDNPDIYVTRSGRRSSPPERLIYDA
jgi:hypothetical protein